MMILFNRLAAQEAVRRGIPIIFRVQGKPTGEVPAFDPTDPTALERLRGLLQPATLSLTPGGHHGLGLPAYTQASSPLRRYADLVVQRQLQAGLSGRPVPHDQGELLRVLAAAETAERELRRVEAAVTERWALEVVARLPDRRGLTGLVLAETPAGLKVELDVSGARGVLPEKRGARPGEAVRVNVTRVEPRRGVLRLALAD
jgi:exoribonuclease-2